MFYVIWELEHPLKASSVHRVELNMLLSYFLRFATLYRIFLQCRTLTVGWMDWRMVLFVVPIVGIEHTRVQSEYERPRRSGWSVIPVTPKSTWTSNWRVVELMWRKRWWAWWVLPLGLHSSCVEWLNRNQRRRRECSKYPNLAFATPLSV